MSRTTVIDLYKEDMSFSAGHFSIFSATERERLHGHNYHVRIQITASVGTDGLTAFDYREYKHKLRELCRQLDEYVLIPENSPFLSIRTEGEYYYCHFNQEDIPFLKKDVLLLPVRNITVEELSYWFLQQFVKDKSRLHEQAISQITICVFSGLGQSGSSTWPVA